MAQKYQVGTVVQLNSGGPLMTVTAYSSDFQNYYCEWFSGDELKSGNFKEAVLCSEDS